MGPGLAALARDDERARLVQKSDSVVKQRRASSPVLFEAPGAPVPFFRLPEREMERREAPGVCETPPGPLRSGPAARHRGRVARPAREARAPVNGRFARPAARGCASRRSTCGLGRLADHARPAGRTSLPSSGTKD